MSKRDLKWLCHAGAAAGVWIGAGMGSASALPITAGLNALSATSAERLIQDPANSGASVPLVGDRLRGIANIDTINGVPFSGGGSELTYIFDVRVILKTTFGGLLGNGFTCSNAFCFEFGPDPVFAAEMTSMGFVNTAGAMMAWYGDVTPDYTQSSTVAVGEATAIDGFPYWLFGAKTADDFWLYTSNNDSFSGTTPGFGSITFGLSLLDRPSGPSLGPLPCFTMTANICANGTVSPGSAPWDSFDPLNINVSVVPEPPTLGLLGVSLIGLSVMSRRRNRKRKFKGPAASPVGRIALR